MAITRERWLIKALQELGKEFSKQGHTLPPVHVSVGFPKGKRTALAECWPTKASDDAVNHIFVTPSQSDPIEIIEYLAHEATHAIDDCTHGHKKEFVAIAKSVGLEGPKWTATKGGEDFKKRAAKIVEKIGAYPHAALVPGEGTVKKQSTRLRKLECSECGYVARATNKWLDSVGALICPCSNEPMDIV